MIRTAEQVRADLQAAAAIHGDDAWTAVETRWQVIATLELPWHSLPVRERRDNRYLICLYCFGWASTKHLSDAHILALADWMRLPMTEALPELWAVLKAALVEQGQMELTNERI